MGVIKQLKSLTKGTKKGKGKNGIPETILGFSETNPMPVDHEIRDLDSYFEGVVALYESLFNLKVDLVAKGTWEQIDSNNRQVLLRIKAREGNSGGQYIEQTMFFDVTNWQKLEDERHNERRREMDILSSLGRTFQNRESGI